MRLALTFLLAATLVLAAATEHHTITLDQSYSASGTVLKPGSYKVLIEGSHATIMKNSKDVLTNIKVETNTVKYKRTELRSSSANMPANQPKLTEIDLGGTRERLVFN